jgi:hypothetical protein
MKMDLREIELNVMGWINLALWQAFVNPVMDLWVHKMLGNFLFS